MPGRTPVTVDEYYVKIQEEADLITAARGLEKLTVGRIPEDQLRKNQTPVCSRKGNQCMLPILAEAKGIIDTKYVLKGIN